MRVMERGTKDIVSDTASYCARYTEKPNIRIYQKILENCRHIGNDSLKRDYYVPPTIGRMSYRQFDGTGIVSVDRTQAEFCTRGRQIGAVIARSRTRSTPALHLAILVDDSDAMTAWSRSVTLDQDVPKENAPAVIAKIATIALFEGITGAQTQSLVVFGSDVDTHGKIDYKRLLSANGAGSGRLDLALSELLRMRWDLRKGERQLVILSSMPPNTGTSVLLDDIGVQEMSLIYMKRMIKKGVRILYLPIFTQMELVDTRIGAYTSRSFAQRVYSSGVSVSVIGRLDMFVPALRVGIKQMLHGANVG